MGVVLAVIVGVIAGGLAGLMLGLFVRLPKFTPNEEAWATALGRTLPYFFDEKAAELFIKRFHEEAREACKPQDT